MSAVSTDGAAPATVRALVLLPTADHDGAFERLLRTMLARGHEVILFDRREVPAGNDVWVIPRLVIRRSLDHLRSLESGGAEPPRDRAPRPLRPFLLLPPAGRRPIARILDRLEAGLPIPRAVRAFVEEQAPDVVLVSPVPVWVDYTRAAEAAGIPFAAVGEHSTVESIERAAEGEPVPARRGRLMRPVLRSLTPLLAILQPRRTGRAAMKAAKRKRKRAKMRRKTTPVGQPPATREQRRATREQRRAIRGQRRATREEGARGRVLLRAATREETGARRVRPSARVAARRAAHRLRRCAAHRLRRRAKLARRATRRIYNRRYRPTYGRTITRVPSRDELPALLNARGLLGQAAEIGVKKGSYSDYLLSNWGGRLISIDPWRSAAPDEYVDRSNVSQEEFERYYRDTRERLERHGSRSSIWRTTSVDAAAKVPDRSLDFVYIDARHDYESVKEDLEAWCTKVRPGGILAGHDYVDGDFVQGKFNVKSAVDEFFGARNLPVHATEGPSAVEMFPSWIVEVPEEGITAAHAEKSGERSPA